MARTRSEAVQERNAALAEEARASSEAGREVNVSALGKKYGMTAQMVCTVLRNAGVATNKKRGRSKKVEEEVISPLHYQLGRDMLEHQFFKAGGRLDNAAKDFGMSTIRLSQMERGSYDPTLTELQHIATVIGVTLPQLLTMRGKNEDHTLDTRLVLGAHQVP